MRIPAALALLCLIAWAEPIRAQSFPAIGDRVRVHEADGSVWTGVLLAASRDSVSLAASGEEIRSLPVGDVVRLERSLGRRRRFWRNASLGWLATTAVVSVISVAQGPDSCWCSDRTDALAWGLLGGGLLGIPVGGLIGVVVHHESWQTVDPGRSDGGLGRAWDPRMPRGVSLTIGMRVGT